MSKTKQQHDHRDDLLDASDIWLVPRSGRVVFDERGNSKWQWPGAGDPLTEHDHLGSMNAADLRIVEPTEIRRSQLPWLHENERAPREFINQVSKPRFVTTSLHSKVIRAR